MSAPESVNTSTPASQAFLDPIPGVIPFGSLCVVAGASGAGKTILFADWLARMRDSKRICGHPTNPSTAYYVLAADRDWSTYHKAYSAAGFPDVQRYVLASDPDFNPQNWGRKSSAFTLFEDCLKKLAPIPGSWVNVDPVAPLFIQGNQNDARDVALSLHWFRKMAEKYQITLALFANVGKQRQEDTYRRAQDRIAGSGAFVAYSDTQISVEQDDAGVMTMRWTPRSAPPEEHQFTFDQATRLFVPHTSSAIIEGETLPTHLARVFELVPTDGILKHHLVKLATEKLTLKKSVVYKHLKSLLGAGILVSDTNGKIQRKPAH